MIKDASQQSMEHHREMTRNMAKEETELPPSLALFDEEGLMLTCFATGFSKDSKIEMLNEMLALLQLAPRYRTAMLTLDANLRDPDTDEIVGECLAHIGFLKKGDTWDLVYLWDAYTRDDQGRPDFDNPPERDPAKYKDEPLEQVQSWITDLFWQQHNHRQTLVDQGLELVDLLMVMGKRGPRQYMIAITDERLKDEIDAQASKRRDG